MESINVMVRFFQDGGIFMYPIVVVFALGVAIAIERWVFLTYSRASNQKSWNELLPLLSKGDYQKAYNMASQSESAVSKIITYGLTCLGANHRLDDVEAAMEEGLMEMTPRLEKRTHYLATLANIATLLGLLGTVVGLIQAFASVTTADPAEKAEMLSRSISVAMNTTAFGLIVAIPFLLLYTVLQTKTTELLNSLEMAGVKFNNLLRRHNKAEGKPK